MVRDSGAPLAADRRSPSATPREIRNCQLFSCARARIRSSRGAADRSFLDRPERAAGCRGPLLRLVSVEGPPYEASPFLSPSSFVLQSSIAEDAPGTDRFLSSAFPDGPVPDDTRLPAATSHPCVLADPTHSSRSCFLFRDQH